jgi:hypothetical protein
VVFDITTFCVGRKTIRKKQYKSNYMDKMTESSVVSILSELGLLLTSEATTTALKIWM